MDGNVFELRKKILTLFGSEFSLTTPEGTLVGYAKQKAFKLREDIRIFKDREMKDEFLYIKARNIIDFSAMYDVFDSQSDKLIGTLGRKGLKSILRDEWIVLDATGKEIAQAREDSMFMALLRRFVLNLIPQNFDVMMGDKRVVDIKQHFNPFVFKMDIVFESSDIPKELGISLAVLLAAIEGRQE